MATPMSLLLEEVSRDHSPLPPATPEEIDAFEQWMGWKLDPDLRAFYLHCNGAKLFKTPTDCPYSIRPLSRIVRARVAIFGKRSDDDAHGPASMYALCDLQGGNYVLVDVAQQDNGRYPLIVGNPKAWPDPAARARIASSFSDFLERVLRSKGRQFWLSG
ncbi:SMI1/KNR4 family protein [Archangium violaceum]|uniref:SMI1/KNR4 family protein n=1 Tax=Archangium violaceum TaxID=83451 RepID=UPI00193B52F5|nr:SMI1/KNR4 family protein [Archangium violaceum]